MSRKRERAKRLALRDPEALTLFARRLRGLSTLIPFQERMLETIWNNRQTTVASGHGMGKGFAGGLVVLGFGCMLPKPLVVVTAPTGRQAQRTLWAELQEHHAALAANTFTVKGKGAKLDLSGHSLNESDWKIRAKKGAQARLTATHYAVRPSEGTAFQGLHSPQLMVMIDEAAGVDDRIVEAAQTLATGGDSRMVLLGNPTNPGYFEDTFKPDSGWATVQASCFEHPNVMSGREIVAGAATRQYIDTEWRKCGDGEPIKWPVHPDGSPAPIPVLDRWEDWVRLSTWEHVWWVGHVLGRFPQEGDTNLVPFKWVRAALDAFFKHDGPMRMGVDVARYGNDLTVVVVMSGDDVVHVKEYPKTSGPEVVGIVHQTAVTYGVHPRDVRIDATGIGGMGVSDWLEHAPGLKREQRRAWEDAEEVVFGSRARDDRFTNRKAELMWALRRRLEKGALGLGKVARRYQDELAQQLRMLRFEYRGARLAVEAKDEYRKRTGSSPDHAEALALAAEVDESEWGGAKAGVERSVDDVMDDAGVMLLGAEKKGWYDLSLEPDLQDELDYQKLMEKEAAEAIAKSDKDAEEAKKQALADAQKEPGKGPDSEGTWVKT